MSTLKLPTKTAAPVEAAPAPAPAESPIETNDLVLVRPTPELNPRTAIMAAIAKRSNEQADVDAKETVPQADEDGNIVTPEAAPVEAVPAAPAAVVAEVPPTVTDAASAPVAATPAGIDPNADYEITVDGNKVKIKGSQVLSSAQKSEAADLRLKLATELLQNAKIQVAGAQPPASAGVVPTAPAAAPAAEEDPAQLAEMIRFGTNEQAAEAIKKLTALKQPTLTPDAVRTIAAQASDHQTTYREATRHVDQEYGDLLADPYLRDLFFFKDDQARKAGDTRSYKELWSAIGDDMRKQLNRPKPAGTGMPAAAALSTAPAPVVTLAQRQAAKAAAPAAPRLASARLESGDKAAKPKTREEVIEEMRRSRGQSGISTAR